MSKYVLTIVFGILGLILGLSNKIVKIEDKKRKEYTCNFIGDKFYNCNRESFSTNRCT